MPYKVTFIAMDHGGAREILDFTSESSLAELLAGTPLALEDQFGSGQGRKGRLMTGTLEPDDQCELEFGNYFPLMFAVPSSDVEVQWSSDY